MIAIFRRMNARHLWERKVRTMLTLAGVSAGVALVFSISVINATLLTTFRSSIRDLAGAAEIEVAAADQVGLPAATVDTVEAIDGVERAVPALRQTTRVVGPDGSMRILVLGVTPEFAALFPGGDGPFGRIDLEGGFGLTGTGIVLSRAVVDEIGEGPVGLDAPSGVDELDVTGVASGGAVNVVNGGKLGVMLLPAAQVTFERENRIDSIYVAVDEDREIRAVEETIDERLEGAAIVGPPGERGRGLERVFAGLGTLLSLAGTVALFVAMFVVYNTMSMSLAERRREMSMAMALGSTRKQLFGAFLFEALIFGVVAAALGIAGGLAMASVLVERAAESYRILPVTGTGGLEVSWGQVVVAAAGGVAVALIGAYVPARRLFSVAPIESLRPEAAYEWGPTAVLGISRRAALLVGATGIGASIASFAIYVTFSQERWLASAGLVAGFTGITFLLPFIVPWAVGLIRGPTIGVFRTLGRLSSDALTKNPGRTTFTVAALVLTLSMAIGVGSALASYERQVEVSAEAFIGAPIYVASSSFTGLTSDQPLPASFISEIERVPGTGYVYPLRFTFADIEGEQGIIFAVPVEQALDAGADTTLESITSDPEAFLEGLSRGDVAISALTAQHHDLVPGDTISLRTPAGRRGFEVAAIYNELISFDAVYLDHTTYARIWNDDKVDEFGVLLDGSAPSAVVEERLERLADESGLPIRVYGQRELIDRILKIVEGTFSLGRGIQFAALIVAALTIANTMFTAVLERRWEMGLQRAVGMSNSQLSRSVLLEAASIGAIGGVGGALLGTASGLLMTRAMEAQFAWQIAFRPPWVLLVGAAVGAVVLAAAAGVLPSRTARRSSIIESLRYE